MNTFRYILISATLLFSSFINAASTLNPIISGHAYYSLVEVSKSRAELILFCAGKTCSKQIPLYAFPDFFYAVTYDVSILPKKTPEMPIMTKYNLTGTEIFDFCVRSDIYCVRLFKENANYTVSYYEEIIPDPTPEKPNPKDGH